MYVISEFSPESSSTAKILVTMVPVAIVGEMVMQERLLLGRMSVKALGLRRSGG